MTYISLAERNEKGMEEFNQGLVNKKIHLPLKLVGGVKN